MKLKLKGTVDINKSNSINGNSIKNHRNGGMVSKEMIRVG